MNTERKREKTCMYASVLCVSLELTPLVKTRSGSVREGQIAALVISHREWFDIPFKNNKTNDSRNIAPWLQNNNSCYNHQTIAAYESYYSSGILHRGDRGISGNKHLRAHLLQQSMANTCDGNSTKLVNTKFR